jgi:hypothetical protein
MKKYADAQKRLSRVEIKLESVSGLATGLEITPENAGLPPHP